MSSRIATLALAAALAVVHSASALAAPAPRLGATYAATVPARAPAGSTIAVAVTLQNTGDETWNASGPGPVFLTYHWESEGGVILVWEGVRSQLGADVPPGGSRTVSATVAVPETAGQYQIRFHLVKEGVIWFPQMSAAHRIRADAPYAVRFGTVPIYTYVSGRTQTVEVPLTNIGTVAWNASGSVPIRLSYHWHDGEGRTLVWDGIRTPLPADVAPDATVTVTATVQAPSVCCIGPVMLTIDLVREGVDWFEHLGGTPVRFHTGVEAERWSARYDAPASAAIRAQDTGILPVTVTNTGNVTWVGMSGVAVSYHVFDGDGRLVTWDGRRTQIVGELRPGESRSIPLVYDAPSAAGTYSLNTEVVREGIAWLSQYGWPPASTRLTVVPWTSEKP